MELGHIIRAEKTNVVVGEWKSGKIPPSAFRIRRKFPTGTEWEWRVITFSAVGRDFRLLIRLNIEKSTYSSILSLESPSEIQIICHHEIHIPHRNWHCHFVPNDVTKTHPNVLRDKERMRVFEQAPSQASDLEFNVTRQNALGITFERFRIPSVEVNPAQGSLEL
jgi:hypothetical protein